MDSPKHMASETQQAAACLPHGHQSPVPREAKACKNGKERKGKEEERILFIYSYFRVKFKCLLGQAFFFFFFVMS